MYKPVSPGWFKMCVLVFDGNTQSITESGFMEKLGIEPATPGLQGIGLSPTPRRLLKTVCGFPGYKPVPPGSFKIGVLVL